MVTLYLLASHAAQERGEGVKAFPGPQTQVGISAVGATSKRPSAQRQEALPTSETVRAGQGRHLTPAGLYCPSGHGAHWWGLIRAIYSPARQGHTPLGELAA